ATLSFFERTGVLVKGHVNYALRYHFTGSVGGSYTRKNFDGNTQRRWNLDIRHNQQFNPNTTLNVNASFVNNRNFYKDLSNNRNERLNRQLVSNATFSTRWGEGKNSFNINLSQTKDLETGRELSTLPRASFTRSQTALFAFDEKKAQRSRAQPKWYNAIRYSYNNLLVNSASKDSSNDTTTVVQRRMEHDVTLSYTNPGRLFGVFTLGHNFTYDEDWFDRTRTYTLDDSNAIASAEVEGFAARRLFQYSASASTKFYGTFNTRLGPVRGLRHVATPTLSFAYQPDFSDPFWRYFEAPDSTRPELRRDRFEGSGARNTPRGETNSLNFGLSNLFQMKLGGGDKEKKIDLFNIDTRGGYNFAADSLRWSNLSTSFRANPQKNLSVSMNMSHSLYDYNRTTGNIRNQLRGPRLIQFGLDARWSLSGKRAAAPAAGAQTQSEGAAAETLAQPNQLSPSEFHDPLAPDNAFTATSVPWSATISFSYTVSKFNPLLTSKNAYLDLSNVEVQLTKNWRIGYRLRYDIERGEVADQRISFYRDLHCWDAQFSWNPSGIGKGFYFKIGIKAPQLRDIKIEQRGGTTSVFRPF
ncbi:MAG TPA: putative LPS assembly protein LptD, partial [bacterium]